MTTVHAFVAPGAAIGAADGTPVVWSITAELGSQGRGTLTAEPCDLIGIECDAADIQWTGERRGHVLLAGVGQITYRQHFAGGLQEVAQYFLEEGA